MQSQVRFNRVPEKVPEKFPGSLCAKTVRFNGFRKRLQRRSRRRFWESYCRSGQVQQVQQGLQRLASQHDSERFVKMKRCGCWGYYEADFFSQEKGSVPSWISCSSCLGLEFRCLSSLFQEYARQFHEFCNAHDLGGNMQCCCLVPMLVQLLISFPNCVS